MRSIVNALFFLKYLSYIFPDISVSILIESQLSPDLHQTAAGRQPDVKGGSFINQRKD